MCSCGCNTCETKGPLLTEGKVKSLLSEGLQYHIDKKIPLFETVYRIGSDKHLALIKEARKMYSRNVIDLCEEDEALIKTHLGEFGIYEGESVPLDLPMLEQTYSGFLRNPEDPDSEKFEPKGSVSEFREDLRALFGKFKGDLKNPEFIKGVAQIMVNWKSLLRSQMDESKYDKEETIQQTIDRLKARIEDPNDGGNVPFLVQKIKDLEKSLNEDKKLTYNDFIQMVRADMMAGASPDEYPSDEQVKKRAKTYYNDYLQGASVDELFEAYSGFLRNPEDPDSEKFEPTGSVAQFREDLRTLFGKFKGDLKNPEFIKGIAQIMVNWKSLLRSQLGEATVNYDFSKEELIRVIKQLKRGASTEIGMIKAFEKALGRELSDDEIRGFKLNEAQNSLLKQSKLSSSEYQKAKKLKGFNKDNYKWNADEDLYIKSIDEAEFKGKDVPLNKPKRGGSKAYYVYVRDPKTKKIKKVSFGSGGLRAKIKNKEARKAFAARHNCKNKKDRTKAGYWSCRLPYYAKILGLGQNMQTFW